MSGKRLLSKEDYYTPVGVFIEAILCGFYSAAFFTSLWIWRQRRTQNKSSASFGAMLYLVLTVLMWCVACLHLGVSMHRVLRVYILELEVGSLPTFIRLIDATRWDNLTHMSLVPAMIWLGDILVVYRTYIVWDRNLWIIALPLVIDAFSLVLNVLTMYWYTHPESISLSKALPWYLALYPLVLAQNLLTTGLLSYKIWSQHRNSVAHGVIDTGGGQTLGYVARIMIESAMFYTVQLLVVSVLTIINHPATNMILQCMVPSIGIVFVLMAVRIHFGAVSKVATRSTGPSAFPAWARDSDDDMELARTTSATTIGRVGLAFRIPDNKSTLEHSDSDDQHGFPPSLSRKPDRHLPPLGSQNVIS